MTAKIGEQRNMSPREALEHYRKNTHPIIVAELHKFLTELTVEERIELMNFQLMHLTKMVLDALTTLGVVEGFVGPGPNDRVN